MKSYLKDHQRFNRSLATDRMRDDEFIKRNRHKFACKLCNHRTPYIGNLRTHVKSVHHKIKDHACHLCDFETTQKSALRNHIKAVHKKIRDQACKLCNFKTSHKQTLRKHIREVHAKKAELEKQAGFSSTEVLQE